LLDRLREVGCRIFLSRPGSTASNTKITQNVAVVDSNVHGMLTTASAASAAAPPS
jgi:hypothetical protein